MAPFTVAILYVCVLAAHIEVLPEIVPGTAGRAFTVTANVLALLVPQVLIAATDTFPL